MMPENVYELVREQNLASTLSDMWDSTITVG